MTLAEIRKHLKRGDVSEISLVTGFTPSYVRKVLNPEDTRHNQRIVDYALSIASTNKARIINALEALI